MDWAVVTGDAREQAMTAEELKELKELIEFLKENKIGEFDLERGDLKVRIKFAQEAIADLAGLARLAVQPAAPVAHASGVVPLAQAAAASLPEPSAAENEDAALHIVKSPIVGTFYESPSP